MDIDLLTQLLGVIATQPGGCEEIPHLGAASRDELLAALEELDRRGWITIDHANRGDDRLLAARGLRATSEGRAALAAAQRAALSRQPTAPTSVAEKQDQRSRVMRAMYTLSGGNQLYDADVATLVEATDLSEADVEAAVDYLSEEGLLAISGLGPLVSITHAGRREVERALSAPTQPTEHLGPMNNVVVVHGGVHNSNVQVGSPGGEQRMELDGAALSSVVMAMRRELEAADLDAVQRAELQSDLDVLAVQSEATHPRRAIVVEALKSLRAVSESAVGSAAFAGTVAALRAAGLL
ncbi:MAG TPA: hypothetical protein VFQ85_00785 [Mycobacteriales bacterium]|nr:hypothetical protein [Mycobacteriales bacterium]